MRKSLTDSSFKCALTVSPPKRKNCFFAYSSDPSSFSKCQDRKFDTVDILRDPVSAFRCIPDREDRIIGICIALQEFAQNRKDIASAAAAKLQFSPFLLDDFAIHMSP